MKRLPLILTVLILACGRDRAEDGRTPPVPKPDALPATATEAPKPSPPPASATSTATEGPKLMPADEAKKDPSLVAYREKLLDAVRRHDVDAVIASADPNIRTSFGEGGGSGVLRRMLESPERWRDLEQILTLGGSFRQRTFWAPYVYSAWPESQDAFTSVAVIAENVPLRSSATGPNVAMLSYDIVQRVGDPKDGWQEVKLSDGRTGFVESKFLRSPIGYRAAFDKEDGHWRMTALVAGD